MELKEKISHFKKKYKDILVQLNNSAFLNIAKLEKFSDNSDINLNLLLKENGEVSKNLQIIKESIKQKLFNLELLTEKINKNSVFNDINNEIIQIVQEIQDITFYINQNFWKLIEDNKNIREKFKKIIKDLILQNEIFINENYDTKSKNIEFHFLNNFLTSENDNLKKTIHFLDQKLIDLEVLIDTNEKDSKEIEEEKNKLILKLEQKINELLISKKQNNTNEIFNLKEKVNSFINVNTKKAKNKPITKINKNEFLQIKTKKKLNYQKQKKIHNLDKQIQFSFNNYVHLSNSKIKELSIIFENLFHTLKEKSDSIFKEVKNEKKIDFYRKQIKRVKKIDDFIIYVNSFFLSKIIKILHIFTSNYQKINFFLNKNIKTISLIYKNIEKFNDLKNDTLIFIDNLQKKQDIKISWDNNSFWSNIPCLLDSFYDKLSFFLKKIFHNNLQKNFRIEKKNELLIFLKNKNLKLRFIELKLNKIKALIEYEKHNLTYE